MAFKVQVGPPQIAIHHSHTILVSELDGQIKWPSEKGLFFRDTRLISNWAIYASCSGCPPACLIPMTRAIQRHAL
jgi:N-terminal domain of (some) glycogen debranching enzymes